MANKKDENVNRKIKEIAVLKKDVPKEILKNIEVGRKSYTNIIPKYNYTIICVGTESPDYRDSCNRAFCITDKEYHDADCNSIYRKLWRYNLKSRRYYAPDTAE